MCLYYLKLEGEIGHSTWLYLVISVDTLGLLWYLDIFQKKLKTLMKIKENIHISKKRSSFE